MYTDSVRGAGGAAMARRAAPALLALAIVAIGGAAAVASDMPLLQEAVAPSAAAQGAGGGGVGTGSAAREAYLITDLGNIFPVDVAPPNMTRIMLGLLDEHENVTREHVERIRMYVDERDIRINATFVNMAEAILNATDAIRDADADMAETERERLLAESRKSAMASVAALTAQIRFVNYDEPAKIVVHRGTTHTIGEFKPFTTLPSDARKFIIYDDPSWLLPDRHIIPPIHSKAYASAGGNVSLSAMPGGWLPIYAGHPYSGPASLWSFGCNCPSGYLQHPFPSASTKTIRMPSDYPYEVYLHKVHSNMAQPPAGPTWQELGTPGRAAETGFHRFAFDTFAVPDSDFDAGVNAYEVLEYGVAGQTPSSKVSVLNRYLGNNLHTPASASWPVGGTAQTWPNCGRISPCPTINFAFQDGGADVAFATHNGTAVMDGRNGAGTGAWLMPRMQYADVSRQVMMLPQIRMDVWGEHNTLSGSYSAGFQFADRINKRIVPVTSPPDGLGGALYDVRAYVRVPFVNAEPMNVSYVSLRPVAATLDLDQIGRDHMAANAGGHANRYGLYFYELSTLGLANCAPTDDGGDDLRCDKLIVDESTTERLWGECRFLSAPLCATHAEIGEAISSRPGYRPAVNTHLPYLEGVYANAMHIPLASGHDGVRMVIDGVSVFLGYDDIMGGTNIHLSTPRVSHFSETVGTEIRHGEATATTSAYAVATATGNMKVVSVVSATGQLELRNVYDIRADRMFWDCATPPRPYDPLGAVLHVYVNGSPDPIRSVDLGLNEQPEEDMSVSCTPGTSMWTVTRSAGYSYPSFVFAGSTSVPVKAGDHVLFVLETTIGGDIDGWSPPPPLSPFKTTGSYAAEVEIRAASMITSMA